MDAQRESGIDEPLWHRLGLVLAVVIKADDYRRLKAGGGYRSSDRLRGQVSAFLAKHHLPDPDPFSCVGAFLGEIPRQSAMRGYGTVIGYLHPRIAMDAVLVSHDDVQDAVYNNKVGNLVALVGSFADRCAALQRAAQRSNPLKYAEARIGRELTEADFERFDTSGDLELNLLGEE